MRQHPLDEARLEVLRYASLVASWKANVVDHHLPPIMQEELRALRVWVDRLRTIDPLAFRGANYLEPEDDNDYNDPKSWGKHGELCPCDNCN